MDFKQWNGFKGDAWRTEIDVRSFIQDNYTPYLGNSDFLCPPTERTTKLMDKLTDLFKKERRTVGFSKLMPPRYPHSPTIRRVILTAITKL